MTYERVQKASSWSSQPQEKTSPFARRPFSVPAQAPTQQEIENEAIQQNKLEAFGLELQAKHGTITPEGQERLTVLQAKMDAFWQQRRENVERRGGNILQRLLNQGGTRTNEPLPMIQTKLTIGEPGDQYEQEADQVAARVVNQINAPVPQHSAMGESVQREEQPEEEKLMTKPEVGIVQRYQNPVDMSQPPSLSVQRWQANFRQQHKGSQLQREQPQATGQVLQAATSIKEESEAGASGVHQENNTGMPDNLKTSIENLSGMSMDDVKVHYNSAKPAEVQALAYTQGTDIHVGQGQEKHLPHEAWHVVQQKQGRVQPTMQLRGVAVNDDSALERESDVMGARAVQMQRAQPQLMGQVEATAQRAGGCGNSGKEPLNLLSTEPEAAAPPASVIQMEREPISEAGQTLLKNAKEYFRKLKRKGIKKKKTDSDAEYIKTKAGELDISKEKNKPFLDLVKDLKAGLHASKTDQIKVEEKVNNLNVEITDERGKKSEAQRQEVAEGGHALGRHGPEVSDELLKRRLFTGIAPDAHLSPAPGASSRFNSYKDVIDTRQKAAQVLQGEIVAAQGKVLNWLITQRPGLDAAHGAAQNDVITKTADWNIKKNEMAEAGKTKKEKQTAAQGALPGSQKQLELDAAVADFNVKKGAFDTATGEKKTTEQAEAMARDEKDHPGKNLKRLRPTLTKVSLDIGNDADTGALEDNVKLVDSYSIVVDHKKAIGSGFNSDEANVIKLQDLLDAVADNPTTPNPMPKPLGDIRSALTAIGIGGDLNDFANYLNDQANLVTVKAKADKGGKIYKTAQDAGGLTKSFTNFKRSGDGKIFDPSDKPLVIDTAAWDAIQHFPASNNATEGIQD